MKAGLVSITFRNRSPEQVIDLCREHALHGIEWGGDIHVPHGDEQVAERVGRLTRDAGLTVQAYGSYYRLGVSRQEGLEFQSVLASALALGAPVIRVWAGRHGSFDATPDQRRAVVADVMECADLAATQNVVLAYELHSQTLTDTTASALALLNETRHPAIRTLWQPYNGARQEDAEASLEALLPWLQHLHVFHWWPTSAERLPLSEGEERWLNYLSLVKAAGLTCPLLLEFVKDDNVDQLRDDAATLHSWISRLG